MRINKPGPKPKEGISRTRTLVFRITPELYKEILLASIKMGENVPDLIRSIVRDEIRAINES